MLACWSKNSAQKTALPQDTEPLHRNTIILFSYRLFLHIHKLELLMQSLQRVTVSWTFFHKLKILLTFIWTLIKAFINIVFLCIHFLLISVLLGSPSGFYCTHIYSIHRTEVACKGKWRFTQSACSCSYYAKRWIVSLLNSFIFVECSTGTFGEFPL